MKKMVSLPSWIESKQQAILFCQDAGFITEIPQSLYYFMYALLFMIIALGGLYLWKFGMFKKVEISQQ